MTPSRKGLMSAMHLASYGRGTLVTKERLQDCNTNFAQGGICCVMDPADTFDKHARDTMIAGAWLGRSKVVHEICEHAPEGIQDLVKCGVKFAKKKDGSWELTREGGHSARRIFHAGDITGEKCEAAMVRRLKKSGVDFRERTIVIDLVMSRRIGLPGENRCLGAYVLDKETGEIYAIRSPNTILATGGCGKVYLYTCNPDTATGDVEEHLIPLNKHIVVYAGDRVHKGQALTEGAPKPQEILDKIKDMLK